MPIRIAIFCAACIFSCYVELVLSEITSFSAFVTLQTSLTSLAAESSSHIEQEHERSDQIEETNILSSYDAYDARKSVWLCAAAACNQENYKTHVFQGPTQGFVLTHVIYDPSLDTQGFIGYLPSDESIYIAFRGSGSIENWETDLDTRKIFYYSYPECHCEVHEGFYAAQQRVFPDVLNAVSNLTSAFPSYKLKVTGYSLGAALAHLTAMDLVKYGMKTSVYNFGMPRIGDARFAAFASAKLTTWRITHDKDRIPHFPSPLLGFAHVCQEVFEESGGSTRVCLKSCEDPTCSNRYPVTETKMEDHLIYLGLPMICAAVSYG